MMSSPKSYSPTKYKHLKFKIKQSPIELKDKLRKDYKSKVQSCRDMLVNRFRGNTTGPEIRNKLKEIYNDLYDFSNQPLTDDEGSYLEEIKNELIQEELEWWLEEYDKTYGDIDWSTLHQEENVICPICQKTNFNFSKDAVQCPNCNITVFTSKSPLDMKKAIFDVVENHNNSCSEYQHFTSVTESSEAHIYAICNTCGDMHLVI